MKLLQSNLKTNALDDVRQLTYKYNICLIVTQCTCTYVYALAGPAHRHAICRSETETVEGASKCRMGVKCGMGTL